MNVLGALQDTVGQDLKISTSLYQEHFQALESCICEKCHLPTTQILESLHQRCQRDIRLNKAPNGLDPLLHGGMPRTTICEHG